MRAQHEEIERIYTFDVGTVADRVAIEFGDRLYVMDPARAAALRALLRRTLESLDRREAEDR